MSVLVNVRRQNGVNLVTLSGAADPDLLLHLADGLAALREDGPIILDLSAVVGPNAVAIRRLVDRLEAQCAGLPVRVLPDLLAS
jgi:hypothetical protein